MRGPSAARSASAGDGDSQRSRIVANAALMSKTPSSLTATTEGPLTSGSQTRAARAPAKPSSGSVIASVKLSVAIGLPGARRLGGLTGPRGLSSV